VIHQGAAATGERGPLDYVLLERGATPLRLPDTQLSVLVMSEEDWIDAKRTPPVREKDRAHLRAYERWRAAAEGR
jgi:hypothetical protein